LTGDNTKVPDNTDAPPPARATARRSYGKTARRSAVWDLGATLTSQGTLMIASVFLARILTPADFGITAATRFFVQLATRVTQLGLNVSLVRMKDITQDHTSSVFVVNLAMGVLAFAILWGFSPFLGQFFGSADVARVLPVSATVFLITPFGSVASAMLQRHLRYRVSSAIQWCDSVLGTILSLGMAVLGFGYWSLVWGALLATVVSTGLKVWMSPWRMSLRFSRHALKDTLSFGLGFQTQRILTFAATNLDNFVIGRFLGVESLGFYDKAYGLMNQFTNRMAFDASLMRIFAIIREEPERFRRALVKGMAATSIVSLPLLMFIAVTAERLVPTMFGDQWGASVGPLQVLAIAGMVRSSARPINAAIQALGFVWQQVAIQVSSLILLLVGIAVGSWWGLTVASLAVLIAAVFGVACSVPILVRNTPVTKLDLWHASWPSLATSAILAVAVTAVHVALLRQGVTRPGLQFTGDAIVAAIVYPALLIWTPFRSISKVVHDSVEDLAPWVARAFPYGSLRPTRKEAA
jgi:O-antigen/teichoic acid export membrane protein